MARTAKGSVFRPVVTFKAADGRKRRRRSGFYWCKYRDNKGDPQRHALKLPNGDGVRDKEVALELLRGILSRQEREAVGLIDPAIEAAMMPLWVVLARFARSLRSLKRNRRYTRNTIEQIKWMKDATGMTRLADLNETNVDKALQILAGRKKSPKTINDYRAAAFGLCRWCVQVSKLLSRNPIEAVAVRDQNGDVRKIRRALTPNEAALLLVNAGRRALWYEVAMSTGLRCDEMRQLQWGDLDLNGGFPCLNLRAKTTKAKRADSIPLKASIVEKLKAAKPPFATPKCRVFKTTPSHATFIRDCANAGIKTEADENGRSVDRHALRTTFITWLSKGGVSPRTAQQLARHTDIKLTMQNYTDPRMLDTASAVESLPDLDAAREAMERAAEALKTGTDGQAVVVVEVSSNDTPNPVVLPVVLQGGISCPPVVSAVIEASSEHNDDEVCKSVPLDALGNKKAAGGSQWPGVEKPCRAGLEPATFGSVGQCSIQLS